MQDLSIIKDKDQFRYMEGKKLFIENSFGIFIIFFTRLEYYAWTRS